MTLFFDLVFHLCFVLFPAGCAALALHRWTISKTRNRLIYAAFGLGAAFLAIRILGDTFAGMAPGPGMALAALVSPIGWAIVLWVVGSNSRGQYGGPMDWTETADVPTAPDTADITRRTDDAPVFRRARPMGARLGPHAGVAEPSARRH